MMDLGRWLAAECDHEQTRKEDTEGRAILERPRPVAVPVTLEAGETAKVEVPVRRSRD